MTAYRRVLAWTFFLALSFFPPHAPERARAGEKELGADDIPVSILDAEVGEWVLYRLADGKRSRLTIVEKWTRGDETYLRILNEITSGGKKRPRRREEVVEMGRVADDLRTLGPQDRVDRSEILLNGRKLAATVVSYYDGGKLTRQSYLSEAIPVYGLIRGVTPDAKVKTTLSLIDYGFSADE